MDRHLSFWIGVFVTILFLCPIGIGVWASSGEQLVGFFTAVFGTVAAVCFILVLALLFRERIFEKFGAKGRASIRELSELLAALLKSAVHRDADKTAEHSAELVRRAAASYSWVSFYRWVTATAIGLLLAIAGIGGTFLVFEQNRKIQEQTQQLRFQNGLASASLSSQIRQLLVADEIPRNANSDSMESKVIWDKNVKCEINFKKQLQRLDSVSMSGVQYIRHIAETDGMRKVTVAALQSFLREPEGAYSIAAALALELLGEKPEVQKIKFSNAYLYEHETNLELNIEANNSVIGRFKCENCSLIINGSVYFKIDKMKWFHASKSYETLGAEGLAEINSCEVARSWCQENLFLSCKFERFG